MFRPEKIGPEEARRPWPRPSASSPSATSSAEGWRRSIPEARGKWSTIYSGVDLDRFLPIWTPRPGSIRQRLRAEHGLGRRTGPATWAALPKKGPTWWCRALGPVARRYPEATLVLVGSKWYGEDRDQRLRGLRAGAGRPGADEGPHHRLRARRPGATSGLRPATCSSAPPSGRSRWPGSTTRPWPPGCPSSPLPGAATPRWCGARATAWWWRRPAAAESSLARSCASWATPTCEPG